MPRPSGLDNFRFTFESILDDSSHIEPDPDPVSGPTLDSQSLSESITRFHEENGRTYHSYRAGSYAYPNDATENDRLDLQYEILSILFGGRNYFAPWSNLNPPTKILDLATGTGQWAIELGDEFPEATVIGTDLSPIQPRQVPPNVRFYIEDSASSMDDWLYGRDFDYIHTRMTLGSWADFTTQIAARAFEHLKPGGWFESQELSPTLCCDDGTMDEATFAPYKWVEELTAISNSVSRPLRMANDLRRSFEQAGFVDVEERILRLPINGWPRERAYKELGKLWQYNMLSGLSAFTLAPVHRVHGRTMEEIELSLVDVRRGFSDQTVHAYARVFVVWGRKPGPAPDVAPTGAATSEDVEMSG